MSLEATLPLSSESGLIEGKNVARPARHLCELPLSSESGLIEGAGPHAAAAPAQAASALFGERPH